MNDQPTDQARGHDHPPTNLTLEQAAAILGISVNAIRQRIKRGTVAATRTDHGWVVDVSHQPPTDRPAGSPTNQQPTSYITPLAELIERQAAELQRFPRQPAA